LTQSFTGLQTGCLIDFTNNIRGEDEEGVFLNQIVVNVTSPFDGPLTCDPTGEGSPFNSGVTSSPTSCTFSNVTITLLSLFSQTGGVGPGGVFSLTFDPNFGSTVDVTLAQNVIGTPEPASALLLLAGVGALAALRKRRQVSA
jgi:PEP-CTERM motif